LNDGGEVFGGLFEVVANRSIASPPSTSKYPTITNPLQHSTNVQGSVGVIVPEGDARSTLFGGYVLSGLFRYGSQEVANGQTVDVAVSLQHAPALTSVFREQPAHTSFSGAVGYRNVGSAYDPIDGVYDVHTGESGLYAVADVKSPTTKNGSFEVTASGYRFADTLARDVAANYAATYNFSMVSSIKASYQVGEIAISQVGRANNIVVTDAQGGAIILPNGGPAVSLTTSVFPSLRLTGGYASAKTQGCNTSAVKTGPPCYAYVDPAATGGFHWNPFPKAVLLSSFFVEGGIQSSTDSLFPIGSLVLPQSSLLTTTSVRIARSASLGTRLFPGLDKGCSTLLLTDENRGGDVNNFAKSAAQPGQTETASFELVPGPWTPSALVAYSRVQNTAPTPSVTSIFVVRLQYAIMPPTYAAVIRGSCS
jgi:hypothetical protein